MYDPDDGDGGELGIFPLIASLAGPILGGILGGGGGEASGSADIGGVLSSILPGLLGGGGAKGTVSGTVGIPGPQGATAAQVSDIVRGIVRSVPPPIRDQMKAVLAIRDADSASAEDLGRRIVQNVGTEFAPQIATMLAALRVGRNQTNATQEHRSIVRDTEHWQDNADAHAQILARLERIEKRLTPGFAMVRGREIDLLGGKTALKAKPKYEM